MHNFEATSKLLEIVAKTLDPARYFVLLFSR